MTLINSILNGDQKSVNQIRNSVEVKPPTQVVPPIVAPVVPTKDYGSNYFPEKINPKAEARRVAAAVAIKKLHLTR